MTSVTPNRPIDVPQTMAAVMLLGNGGYEQLAYRTDVPVPHPGVGEVLIRIAAAGVNNTDINTRTAWYSRSVTEGTTAAGAASGLEMARAEDAGWTGAMHTFPKIQGADVCGVIAQVGEGVSASRLGQRVLVEPIIRRLINGREQISYFGSECNGGFAQYTCIPDINAHALESRFSDVELASLPCAYGAAEHMLHRCGVRAGQRVLITGASGGVGSAAIQLATRRGAYVVAIATLSKAPALKALGAAEVLARDCNIVDCLGEESIDAVVDVVGGAQFGQLLRVLRRKGCYAVAGAIAGPVVDLDLRTLYLKDLRLEGCTVYSAEVFRNLVGYIEREEIRPLVAATFPLREIVAAQRQFTEKGFTGKIVLIP